jgi:predicted amidophosphoribosyltransferase
VATELAPPGADITTINSPERERDRQLGKLRCRGQATPHAEGAVAGLYLPSFHPGHTKHELTQKIRRSKASREHDLEFAERLATTLTEQLPGLWAELLVSIPPSPGDRDRFTEIRAGLAGRIGAADGGRVLCQTRLVADYRQMTTEQRNASCAGRFAAQVDLGGKSVLLIDDVITSGAQADEAIRTLKMAGAERVSVLALAVAAAVPCACGGPPSASD